MTEQQLAQVEKLWHECESNPAEVLTGVPEIDNPVKLAQTVPMLLGEIKRLRAPKAVNWLWRAARYGFYASGVLTCCYIGAFGPVDIRETSFMFAGIFAGLWFSISD